MDIKLNFGSSPNEEVWRCSGCMRLQEKKYYWFDGEKVCVECYSALLVGLRNGGMNTSH